MLITFFFKLEPAFNLTKTLNLVQVNISGKYSQSEVPHFAQPK